MNRRNFIKTLAGTVAATQLPKPKEYFMGVDTALGSDVYAIAGWSPTSYQTILVNKFYGKTVTLKARQAGISTFGLMYGISRTKWEEEIHRQVLNG